MTKQHEAIECAAWLENAWGNDGTPLSTQWELRSAAELRRLHEVNEDLLKTLRQLACLGNGDQYGNSDGNIIAQVALNKATGETE